MAIEIPQIPTNGTRLALAKVMVYVGAACVGAAAFINQAMSSGERVPWFPIALATIGAVKALLGFLGYMSSETMGRSDAAKAAMVASLAVSNPSAAAAVIRGGT